MESIFNGLIEFDNKKEFDDFITNIDVRNAIKVIEMSLEVGCKSGIYSIEENYIIYRCLTKLKENEKTYIPDNNNNRDTNNI